MLLIVPLLLLLVIGNTRSQQIIDGNVFEETNIWFDLESYLRHHKDQGGYPRPWWQPYIQFNKDVHLMYFTKSEYADYGQNYWSSDERLKYHNFQYPFDYAVQKYVENGGRLVRFINYSTPLMMDEADIVERFVDANDADKKNILLLVSQRLYKYSTYDCSVQYVQPNYSNPLEIQVFRHVVLGYNSDFSEFPIYNGMDLRNMTASELVNVIQMTVKINKYKLTSVERHRRNIFNKYKLSSVEHHRRTTLNMYDNN